MGKSKKQAKNKALHICGVIRSLNNSIIQVRRESDDKVITVDLTNKEGKSKLKDFCKGTNGYLDKWG